jgi:hypothetical protein
VPGYVVFRKIGFTLFKKVVYGSYTTRKNKLQLFSDPLLGEERFLLADQAEYGTRFILTPSDPQKVIDYLKDKNVTHKSKSLLSSFI